MKPSLPIAVRFVLGFSLGGFLFAGYLSFYKLISGTCAFNESCPTFLGHPSCWYGFALYTAILLFAIFMATGRLSHRLGLFASTGVALLGVAFSGYFTALELPALIENGVSAYTFGLPTCALGLIFFILTFIAAAFGTAYRKA